MPEIPVLEKMRQDCEIKLNHKGCMAKIRPASLHDENVSKFQRTHKEETAEIQINKSQK